MASSPDTPHVFPAFEDRDDLRGSFHRQLFLNGVVQMDQRGFEQSLISYATLQQLGYLIRSYSPEKRLKLQSEDLRQFHRKYSESLKSGPVSEVDRLLGYELSQFRQRLSKGLSYTSAPESTNGECVKEYRFQPESLLKVKSFGEAFTEYTRAMRPEESQCIIMDDGDAWSRFLHDHQLSNNRLFSPRKSRHAKGLAGEYLLQRLLDSFAKSMQPHGVEFSLRHAETGEKSFSDMFSARPKFGHNFSLLDKHAGCSNECDALVEFGNQPLAIFFDAKTGRYSDSKQEGRWRELRKRLPSFVQRICVKVSSFAFGAYADVQGDNTVHKLHLGFGPYLPELTSRLIRRKA